MIWRAAIISATLASAAIAQQTPLTGAAFEQMTTGVTHPIAVEGEAAYGATTFHPGRRVTWHRFADNFCTHGTWDEPSPGVICFDYPHRDKPICWSIYAAPVGFNLTLRSNPTVPYVHLAPVDDVAPCDLDQVGS